MRGELRTALDVPSKMRTFLTKNMNIWLDRSANGYMPMDKWRACGVGQEGQPAAIPDLTGHDVYVGVDLSSKIDLTSVAFEFPMADGRYVLLSHSFMPEETVAERRGTDKMPYDSWIEQGWITETPGAVIDTRTIMQYIDDMVQANGWVVREICVDPWGDSEFAREMTAAGYTVMEVPQGIKTLSGPTKHFRERVLDRRVLHDHNPVLGWAMSNAVERMDPNENIMVDKRRSRQRIDPVAAAITAHFRAMHADDGPVDDVSEFADADFLDKLWG